MWHRSVRFISSVLDFRFLVCYTVDSKGMQELKKQELQEEEHGKRHIYFLADGFEEIEGLTVVDILRRAGVEIQMVFDYGTQRTDRQSRDSGR